MQNGMLISKIRSQKKLTQQKLADYLNVTLSVYKLYEASIRPMKIEELNQLSKYFKISLNTLLGLSSNLAPVKVTNIDYKYLKFSLRYIRRRNRISQKQLAKDLNVSISSVANYEKHPEKLNASYLHLFAEHFQISVDYICGKTLKKEVL